MDPTTDTTNWRPDPYGVHEFRFFSSDGKPTLLVMDRGETSYDKPPPLEPPLQPDLTTPSADPSPADSAPGHANPTLADPAPAIGAESGEAPFISDRWAARSQTPKPAATCSGRDATTPVATGSAPDGEVVQTEDSRAPQPRVIHPTPEMEHRDAEPMSRALKIAYAIVLSVLVVSIGGLFYVHVHHTTANSRSIHSSGAPTTTVSALHGTTTVPSPAAPKQNAESAAQALVASWSTGNRPQALTVATPTAVATLFAKPYASELAIDRGCSTAFTPIVCTFGPAGGASPTDPIYQVFVSQGSGGWFVSAVRIQS